MSNTGNAMTLLRSAVKAKDAEGVKTAFAALKEADPTAAEAVFEGLIAKGFSRL